MLERMLRAALCSLVLLGASSARADAWLGPDKALHFGVSAALARASYDGASLALDAPPKRAAVAATVALSLGAAKELYDLSGRGDPSAKDLAWDAAGTAVGVGLSLALDWALRDDRSWLSVLRAR